MSRLHLHHGIVQVCTGLAQDADGLADADLLVGLDGELEIGRRFKDENDCGAEIELTQFLSFPDMEALRSTFVCAWLQWRWRW